MAYVITRLCIRGGECMEVCPVNCIIPGPKDSAWPYLYIDPDNCIDCGACLAECPKNAIFPEVDVPAQYAQDSALNRKFFAEGPGYWKFDMEEVRKERVPA